MKATSQEFWYHLRVALVPLTVLLCLWRPAITLGVAGSVAALYVIYVVVHIIVGFRREKRAAVLARTAATAPGNDVCDRDGELSLSALTPDLEELETQATEMFGGKVSLHFLVAINAVDSAQHLTAFLDRLPQNEGEDIFPSVPLDHETFYLLKVAGPTTTIRHKLLYEYRRKVGSLAYHRGDRQPLLTRQELMRRLAPEEREAFLAFCQSLAGGESYYEEREQFLAAPEATGNGAVEPST